MTMLTGLIATYNLPFTILLALCLLFGVLQLVGLGGEAPAAVLPTPVPSGQGQEQ